MTKPRCVVYLLPYQATLASRRATLRSQATLASPRATLRSQATLFFLGESTRNAMFPGDTGESECNAAFPGDTGDSACNAAFPGDTGDSACNVAFPGDTGESPRNAKVPGDIGVDVRSMYSTMHDLGLGGGASKLCSHISNTAPSAVGTNLPGNFNACIARLASSVGTVMHSSAGHGTSKRFRCRRHSSKQASVRAGARKYSCEVSSTTGAMPSWFRSGAKMCIAWNGYFCVSFAR